MTKRPRLLLTLSFTIIICSLHAQTITDKTGLTNMSKALRTKETNNLAIAKKLAKQNGWFLRKVSPNGKVTVLIGVDELGHPKYVSTLDNIIAAATTSTSPLWPGGSSGLNLSGSSNAVKGKLAIWDGGHPLTTHVEFSGRVTLKDVASVEGHPTHTSGTMIAAGINPIAKGMAFGAQQLLAYDFSNDESEMAGAASGLLLSNHSYGYLSGSGWDYDGTNYYWYGDTTISKTYGYAFGYYSSDAQIYDSIAYHAPYYLICVAAGNARGYGGPPLDSPYYYNNNSTPTKFTSKTSISPSNPNYTSISNAADAKNILLVGAVNGIPSGYNSPSDVSIAYFSSLGPTNDGRIKPDIVADGVNVTSSWNTSNNAYQTESGTSMATPNTTGSLYLLQEYYDKLHPNAFMRSATLKGLAIHTANEAGSSEGPDYTYGWGLLNTLKAANVITSSFNQVSDTIIESTLTSGTPYTFSFTASGKGQLAATLSWTDPAATPLPIAQAQSTQSMLVNDLDMRITNGSQVYYPWILNPSSPSSAATRGDNFRDNVEKINIDSLVPGQTYTLTVTNKGTLTRGPQAFSLLVSGIGGQAYCSSGPTSSSGTRIDSVSFSNVQLANPAGCTNYSNYTNYIAQVQSNQKLPIYIKLGSCDGSTANKIVKVYIDYNNNGVFDASELAAQSGVLNGNAVYEDSIATPQLTTGNTTRMRIVAVETSDPSQVQPCGSYGNGETQDYTVEVVSPTHDLALIQLLSPTLSACSDTAEIVSVNIRNVGQDTMYNVPLTAIISNGSTVVKTMNETYPGTIPPNFLVTYTFQNTFAASAGSTYNIKTFLTSSVDQNLLNDTLNNSISIAAAPSSPTGTARVSNDTVTLTVTDPSSGTNYFWYNDANSDTAIARSASTFVNTSQIPTNGEFYVGSGAQSYLGIKSKNNFPNGGGYQAGGGNWLAYTSTDSLTLVSAKMYTGNPGKVTIMVVDTVTVNGNIYYYVPALSSTTIDVYSTSSTPTAGSRNNDPTDSGAVFFINLPLPTGSHVIIDTTVDASVDQSAIADATIFRNNNVTGNPYPFRVPNLISITGNSATSTTNPNQYQGYYYYLYNMKVETPDCISGRSAVPISGFSNTEGLKVGPNPSTNGVINVFLNTGTSGNLQIELYDLVGRRCFSQNYSTGGYFSNQISTADLANGMYILTVRQGNNLYKTKIIVLR